MDVTTFDARITREATDSLRNSGSANVGSAKESVFAEHLLPRTAPVRPTESPETSLIVPSTDEESPSTPEATAEDLEEQPLDGAVTSDQSAPDGTTENDTSSESEQEEIAALAAASATPPGQTPPPAEPAGATSPQTVAEAATDTTDTPQPTAKTADGTATAQQEIPATLAADPVGEPFRGDPHEAMQARGASNESPVDKSSSLPPAAATVAAIPNPNALEATSAQDAASSGATAESAEKSTASTKSRTGKSTGKPNGSSTKGNPAESTNGEPTSPTETKASDNSSSHLIPGADQLPADAPGDRSTQHPTNVAVGNEVDAARDNQTRTQSLTERLPEQIFGKSSAAGASDELSSVDQMRLIQRVARAIEVAPQNGGILRLRLRPPELGAVRLEVAMQRGKMTARIETETAQARNVLLDQLPQLRERLEGQGIRIERFDVEVGSRNQGDSPSHSSHTDEAHHLASRENRPQAVETETNRTVAPETRRMISATRVNVVI